MAEGQDSQENREIFVGGRARVLLNAMVYFENKRVGRGGAGRTPNLSISNNRGMTRWEVGPPCGRAHALSTLVPGPGGLSSLRGRGRGLSLPTPTTPLSTPPSPARSRRGRGLSLQTPTTPPHPLGRGFPSSSPPISPPPLEDCSPPMRCQETPLRQPHSMPCCLQPHGSFPSPPLCFV